MATFDYTAITPEGKSNKGVLQAESVRQARLMLTERGIYPVEVLPSSEATQSRLVKVGFARPLSTPVLVAFTRQLAVLIESGIPIDEALAAIAQQHDSSQVQRTALTIRSSVLEGHSLSVAAARMNGKFSTLYLTMLRAGEQSGALGKVLERLADFLEERQALQSSVRIAMIYPLILTLISISVIGVLMAYVVPKIISQFDHAGQALPWITQLLISCSELIQHYGHYALLVVVFIGFGIRWLLRTDEIRLRWHRFCLKVPFVSSFLVALSFARFCRTVDILLHSGLSLLETLRIAHDVISNDFLRGQLVEVADSVEEGKSLADSLARVEHVPALMLYMISNGERSGELASMFSKVANMLESNFTAKVKVALAVFEPLLILMMGGVVLTIVMAILLPILELNNMTML